MPDTTKISFEDGTDDYALSCNDCGAHVVNGKAEDIKHHATCTPTPMDDDYYNPDHFEEIEHTKPFKWGWMRNYCKLHNLDTEERPSLERAERAFIDAHGDQ